MDEEIINSCPAALLGTSSSLFLNLINALLIARCRFSPSAQYPTDYGSKLRDGDRFDFIVVGAGSAGSVVASRLSENPKWKVLLLEAGSYPSSDSEVPSLAYHLQSSKEDWQYKSEPSANLRLKKRQRAPRGKGLGGSSLINYIVYSRGNRYDYDGWSKAGNVGWDYDSVTQYFRKHENVHGTDENRYGRGGELNITKYEEKEPVMVKMIDAYKEMGYSHDYSEEKPLGSFSGMFSVWEGKRQNTAKAFLGEKVKNRSNLFVALNAQVSKLLVDSDSIKGVEVRLNDILLKIYAEKEVILSAGSVNSPQILMNSGIGPKTHLEDLGIKVVKDLKVGENLQDHIGLFALYYTVDKSATKLDFRVNQVDMVYEYFMHSKGLLADLISTFVAFVNPKNDSNVHSLQIYTWLQPRYFFNDPSAEVAMDAFELHQNIRHTLKEASQNSHILQFPIILSFPKSRGRILLNSNDSFDAPLIFPNYLSNEEDVSKLKDGIRFMQTLMKTKAMEAYNPKFLRYFLDDCKDFIFDTDEYWDCMIRNLVRTDYHLVGTCKMGPKSDSDAVVDPRLRVYGLKGVRVIDGSIIPTILSANTNGPIMMIGEKGSDMIKEDWAKKIDEL
ncbi:hypothetical protein RI129_012859 [Pyrocoelia pectoralis]|uniref:Glucose-methanol-choline oxidoreductase N-terminal domain-containing protein n=1 Tax=Pyrocoelia pectoralis TaxID=417401 RepID=A0AAN7V751_9COLE